MARRKRGKPSRDNRKEIIGTMPLDESAYAPLDMEGAVDENGYQLLPDAETPNTAEGRDDGSNDAGSGDDGSDGGSEGGSDAGSDVIRSLTSVDELLRWVDGIPPSGSAESSTSTGSSIESVPPAGSDGQPPVRRSMARPKLTARPNLRKRSKALAQDTGIPIPASSLDDEAYSPCQRRKGVYSFSVAVKLVLRYAKQITGFDENRGTEVAYSVAGELGLYLPNVIHLQEVTPSPNVTSMDESPILSHKPTNSLKSYYDSVRQPKRQPCSSNVRPVSPFPRTVRVVTATPPRSPAKGVTGKDRKGGREHKRSQAMYR